MKDVESAKVQLWLNGLEAETDLRANPESCVLSQPLTYAQKRGTQIWTSFPTLSLDP